MLPYILGLLMETLYKHLNIISIIYVYYSQHKTVTFTLLLIELLLKAGHLIAVDESYLDCASYL